MILLDVEALSWYQTETFARALRILALAVLGLPAVWLAGRWVRSLVTAKFNAQQGMITGRAVFYSGFVLVTTMILNQLGFQLTALLGALGIAGVAVGFAAQTSAANIISGIFLVIENPFSIGDVVKVGETLGEVLSLDLFSAKIRTFDNKLVRIPNESLVKATVVNFSRFPIRRVDLDVTVSYGADLTAVKDILLDAAAKNPLALAEPQPAFFFSNLSDKGVGLFLGVWTQSAEYGNLKNGLIEEIRMRFKEAGIAGPATRVELKSEEQPAAPETGKPAASARKRRKR